MNDAINNGANTINTNIINQEHQDDYHQRNQQYIGCKYNSGLEQVTLEVVPNIILEEEEENRFHQWADQYNQWDNTLYIPMDEEAATATAATGEGKDCIEIDDMKLI